MKEYISTPEGMNQMWEKINEVLDMFEFTSVKRVMEALDWGWVCTKEEADEYAEQGCKVEYSYGMDGEDYCHYYPEYPQLLKHARDMIKECINDIPDGEDEWMEETGGFKVRITINEGEEIDDFEHAVDIELYFIVEQASSY